MAYIENNPVRAAIVTEAEQYRWSSALSHVTATDTDHLLQMGEWRREYTTERWKSVLRNTVDAEADRERIGEATTRGHPLGDHVFSTHLESILGPRLTPNRVGLPKNTPPLPNPIQHPTEILIAYTVPAFLILADLLKLTVSNASL
jgi:hypothetical protein